MVILDPPGLTIECHEEVGEVLQEKNQCDDYLYKAEEGEEASLQGVWIGWQRGLMGRSKLVPIVHERSRS
jgi:hypothetical protein